MTTQEILNYRDHRPWNLPYGVWQYYQEWQNVVFLHWQVERKQLEKFVPGALEMDVFDGDPWVSLVAFTMCNVRTKDLPAFPPISNFHEINIRTYVRSGNKAGVYFLSIEGGKRISCSLARRMSELPYRFSDIRRSNDQYLSSNKVFNDMFRIDYTPGKILSGKTPLDHWLVERYALFQDCTEGINEFEIHHREWPLSELHATRVEVDYPRFRGLINRNPDKLQYSEGVQVLAWPKQKILQNDPINFRSTITK